MSVRRLLFALTPCLFCLFVCAQARAQSGMNGANGAGGLGAPREEARDAGNVTTLYTLDPLSSSLCLADGKYGRIFQENETKNRCSDLDFGSYYADNFSVGIEGGRVGVILDLGDAAELKKRYGFEETVGMSQGFASLHAEGDKVFVLKERRPQTFQELQESGQLFAEGKSVASAPIKVGYIYLVRLTDRHHKDFQLLAKLKVVAYVPGESVTVRWQVL
ncbi:MAG: hypothetical protein JOZ96_05675 [Acidobacteria bacterium]|nr:hypothetical protein [Acidobacteriota bacterium]